MNFFFYSQITKIQKKKKIKGYKPKRLAQTEGLAQNYEDYYDELKFLKII